jgi:hypothetical protein
MHRRLQRSANRFTDSSITDLYIYGIKLHEVEEINREGQG